MGRSDAVVQRCKWKFDGTLAVYAGRKPEGVNADPECRPQGPILGWITAKAKGHHAKASKGG